MRWAIALVILVSFAAVLIGTRLVENFPITLPVSSSNVSERIQELLKFWPLFSFAPAMAIWWQNVRAMLIGMVMGAFSFGILGLLPLFITMAVVGFLFQTLVFNGLPAGNFFIGFILPHGIIEIPAAILATAAVVQAGARLATPSTRETIGETWIRSLADWAKIMLGIVLPLMAVSALVETWLTPQIAALIIR
jgi:uncharacterized membrane protein SpoIIM required for sporulation